MVPECGDQAECGRLVKLNNQRLEKRPPEEVGIWEQATRGEEAIEQRVGNQIFCVVLPRGPVKDWLTV